jgi:hypothetical protein
MKYTCKQCNHSFQPPSQFETGCPACGSEDTMPLKAEGGDFFLRIREFISKKPNRYILIGLLILIILLMKLCNGKETADKTYYKLTAIDKTDCIQFVIESVDKDENGNDVGETKKITGKNVEQFGIYIIIDGRPVKLDGNGGLKLVDGDKFYGFCTIDPNPLQFMIDPKRERKNCTNRSVSWLQKSVSNKHCCRKPVPLVAGGVIFKQIGTNIVITTNLDTIPDHATIYYSITGKEGPYEESKNTWDACSLTQIEGIWVTTGADDTTSASGAFPYVVDKSACPCTPAEAQALKNSIQNAGNAIGANMTDYNLLSRFDNSFIVKVDSDGNGSLDKQIASNPANARFIINGKNLSYMEFQSEIFGLTAPVKRYTCTVSAVNCKISTVTFQ